MTAYRLISGSVVAARIAAQNLPKPKHVAAKLGLRYERKVNSELKLHVKANHILDLEHNPWFAFRDNFGPGICSPDFIFRTAFGHLIVAEVKYTWTPEAALKFESLYFPVLATLMQEQPRPLYICRNLAFGAPKPEFALSAALNSSSGLLHWPQIGHILW
jgi:hypothetical protein